VSNLSWHQQRAAGLHRMPDDIVGYSYRAGLYCPECCTTAMLTVTGGCTRDEIATQPTHTVEAILNVYARRLGIDRSDETTFDAGDFPKVVFRDMVGSNLFGLDEDADWESDRCGACGKELASQR